MSQTEYNINLLFALTCEAKPWIERLKLKKVASKPFTYYSGVWGQCHEQPKMRVHLLISGSTQIRMAAAVAWLGAMTNDYRSAWLNIGTAGHMNATLGTLYRIHQVTDDLTGQSLYPPMTVRDRLASVGLKTLAAPSSDYTENEVVDMEGYAFFSTAQRFADVELVQAIKVISDNVEQSIELLDAKRVSALMQTQLDASVLFINALLDLLVKHPQLENDDRWVAHLHCSVSQRHQYHELMRRLRALRYYSQSSRQPFFEEQKSMSHVLKLLQQQLDTIVPVLGTEEAGNNG